MACLNALPRITIHGTAPPQCGLDGRRSIREHAESGSSAVPPLWLAGPATSPRAPPRDQAATCGGRLGMVSPPPLRASCRPGGPGPVLAADTLRASASRTWRGTVSRWCHATRLGMANAVARSRKVVEHLVARGVQAASRTKRERQYGCVEARARASAPRTSVGRPPCRRRCEARPAPPGLPPWLPWRRRSTPWPWPWPLALERTVPQVSEPRWAESNVVASPIAALAPVTRTDPACGPSRSAPPHRRVQDSHLLDLAARCVLCLGIPGDARSGPARTPRWPGRCHTLRGEGLRGADWCHAAPPRLANRDVPRGASRS